MHLVIDCSGDQPAETLVPLTEIEIAARDEEARDMDAARIVVERVSVIDGRLAAIDVEAIRPLRARAVGTATQFDTDKLAALEAEAATLRGQRAALLSPA